jgi:hypothetical protein
VVLAAIGLWYDDYDPANSPSPVTDQLLGVLSYTTGVEENDAPFSNTFPYEAMPWAGDGNCGGQIITATNEPGNSALGLTPGQIIMKAYPNPFTSYITINYRNQSQADVTVKIYDSKGKQVGSIDQGVQSPGEHQFRWEAGNLPTGTYFASIYANKGNPVQTVKLVKQ